MVPITFRTDDATRWGSGQGSNLSAAEIDANFYNLATAIASLQTNPAQPNNIASISVSGTQMTIVLQDGTQLGPFQLPTLMFRWRGAWTASTVYAQLDVFTVDQVGIFATLVGGTSGATFDPAYTINGAAAYQQLFGAVDARLSGLSDVTVSSLAGGQVLEWNATDQKWENVALGSMATQDADAVAITGGSITGLPKPVNASDAVTKAYADALVLGSVAVADGSLIANISGITGAGGATTVSALFDHVLGNVRGSVIFRTGTGWTVLTPGTLGQVLKSGGPGADVSWGAAGAGVTDIAAGTGISTGGSDITSTGSISLAPIDNLTLLANTSGATAAPVPVGLGAMLDASFSSTRGAILFRGASGWTALGPGTSGKYLMTSGAGADPIWNSPAGAGTVTDIAAGTGISTGGADITSTGTISLAAIADGDVLANITGASAAPLPTTITLLLDHVLSSTQGAILYRSATAWSALGPGTNGQVLTTGGAAANPSWANAPSGGTISDKQVLANISGSTAAPIGKNLSDVFDYVLGSNQGDILYRSASGWTVLAPGRAGQVLETLGTGANPSWTYAAGQSLHQAVSFATTGPLPSCTYANGTSGVGATLTATANGGLGTIDGVVTSGLLPSPVGYRCLVKNQADARQNGVYSITQEGDSTHPWVLTRAGDSDQGLGDPQPNVSGGHTWFIEGGTANGSSMWMSHSDTVPLVMGTSQITFTQVAGAAATSVSGQLDSAFGATQGMILYRDTTQWSALAPGTAGQVLATGGSGANPTWSNPARYDIACYVPGTMTASQKLLMHRFSKAVTIPANFGSYLGRTSQAGGSANATASTVITVNKAASATPTTFSSVGTITIAAGSVTPTFATTGGTAVSFAQGDILQLVGPATADTTLADFCATLVGSET